MYRCEYVLLTLPSWCCRLITAERRIFILGIPASYAFSCFVDKSIVMHPMRCPMGFVLVLNNGMCVCVCVWVWARLRSVVVGFSNWHYACSVRRRPTLPLNVGAFGTPIRAIRCGRHTLLCTAGMPYYLLSGTSENCLQYIRSTSQTRPILSRPHPKQTDEVHRHHTVPWSISDYDDAVAAIYIVLVVYIHAYHSVECAVA